MALDDPEAWEIYRQIMAEKGDDPLIHVLTNLTGVSNFEVNAFQRASRVIIQKSIREGFGLVVSEALWKNSRHSGEGWWVASLGATGSRRLSRGKRG